MARAWTQWLLLTRSSAILPVLDDWDDRYRYLIELGRELPPLAARGDAKVR
jgi:sulfur transfer protein SufE